MKSYFGYRFTKRSKIDLPKTEFFCRKIVDVSNKPIKFIIRKINLIIFDSFKTIFIKQQLM